MLLAGANNGSIGPIVTPTATPKAVEETIVIGEATEASTSAELQVTPLAEATPMDISSPSWIALLLIVLVVGAMAVYQLVTGKKDVKKTVAKKRT